MFKNIFRILLILFALILVAASIPIATFHLIFPQSRLHAMLVNGLRGSMLRDVSAGRITLGLTEASVTDLAVSEFPDFRAGTFLSMQNLAVSFSISDLLRHQQPVSGMRLDRPRLRVAMRADGTTSFDRLISADRKFRVPFFLLAKHFEIRGGSLELRDDARQKNTMDVRNIDGDVEVASFVAPARVRLAGTAEKKGMPPLRVAFTGGVSFVENKVIIDTLTLGSGDKTLAITGSIERWGKSRDKLDLAITGDRAVLEQVAAFLSLPPDLQLGDSSKIDVAVSGVSDRLCIRDNGRNTR